MAQKHDISCIEKPMTVATTEQGPQKRYRRLRFPSFDSVVWSEKNPLLQKGELGHEKDTGRFKVGDGVTYWEDLPYNSVGDKGDKGDNATVNGYNIINIVEGRNISVEQEGDTLIISATGEASGSYNKDEIDNKIAVVNASIDANSDAIQKTRNDYIEADSEIHQILNSHAGELTTLKNNQDELGDQVSGIEEKIPENASAQNQMATKSDITNKITNCITEIPQDIKLELADGVLKLKAGSIVYVPNGAGVFNKRTVATDVTPQDLSNYPNGKYLVFDNSNFSGTSLRCNLISECYSGATAPATGTVWYDTTNNKIMVASGSTWSGNRTFPLGIVTISNGAITSIDQVFNGFGYIGSTIFTLPGIKGLIPNGRNKDGTLKNIVVNNTSVKTVTKSGAYSAIIAIGDNGVPDGYSALNYYPEQNMIVSSTGTQIKRFNAGTVIFGTGGKITSFEPKTTFHAVDYGDTDFIAHQAMPSGRRIDLSSSVTDGFILNAPADGYFYLGKYSTDTGQRIRLLNTAINSAVSSWSSGVNQNLECMIFAAKGQNIKISITADGSINGCVFVYSNGAK